jgi:hypothetical protein
VKRRFDWLAFLVMAACVSVVAHDLLPYVLHNPIHLGLFRLHYAIGTGLVIGFIVAWE